MTTPLAPVTCYIRTKNEERMIGRVIEAAKQAVSDVVIVDCGSTDATLKIAATLGARVIHQEWLGNGRQKRVGEDAALHDWVLDLDADEVVSPALAEEIKALFAKGAPPCPVYQLDLVTAPPIGEVWYDVAVADRRKLYNRQAIRIPDHAAWDQFQVPAGMKVGRLKGALLHYSYRDFEQFVAKMNRMSTVRANEAKLKPMWQVALRVVFGPPFYFWKFYVNRGHWKNGLYGFAVSGISAHGRWLRDAKMLERHMKRRQDEHARR